MAGQMTSQFMAAAAQQISSSSQNIAPIHSNGNPNLYPSVALPGNTGQSGIQSSNINEHTSSSLSSPLGVSGVILGNSLSSSSATAAAAASFAAFGSSSM